VIADIPSVAKDPAASKFVRPLEPVERISEALFGLIMVLTFTCSISVAQTAREDVRTMLMGALGCNLVWGVIDAVLYLMSCLAERGTSIATLRSVRRAGTPREAQQILAGALPSVVASLLTADDLERFRRQLMQLPEPPRLPRLGAREWLGAGAIFLWVVVITLPVAIPFVIVHDVRLALRISNLVAVALLFVAGYGFGRTAGLRPWATGLVMVTLGAALVAATIALGG
jgi:VIT1/CCC1 family predicted Fe2+/Mn2+ transporter